MESTPQTVPPELPVAIRTCIRCGVEKPETDEYYDRDESKESGFRATCKDCRAEARRLANIKKTQLPEMIEQLDARAMDLIVALSDSKLNINLLPHIANVVEDLMAVFGGTAGLAQRMMANYIAAPAGSQTRQRYESMVMKAIDKMNDAGVGQKPVESMSDEELQKLWDQHAKRVVAKVTDARPVSEKTAERSFDGVIDGR